MSAPASAGGGGRLSPDPAPPHLAVAILKRVIADFPALFAMFIFALPALTLLTILICRAVRP